MAIAAQIGLVGEGREALQGGEPHGEPGEPGEAGEGEYDTSRLGQMGLATTALAFGNLLGSAVGGPIVDRVGKWNRVVAAAVLLNGRTPAQELCCHH